MRVFSRHSLLLLQLLQLATAHCCCCCGRVLHTFRSRRSHFRRCHFHSIYLLRLWLLVFLSSFRICSGSFAYCISIIFSYSFNSFLWISRLFFYEPKRKRTTSQQKELKKYKRNAFYVQFYTMATFQTDDSFRPTKTKQKIKNKNRMNKNWIINRLPSFQIYYNIHNISYAATVASAHRYQTEPRRMQRRKH